MAKLSKVKVSISSQKAENRSGNPDLTSMVLEAVKETDRGPKGASIMAIKKYLIAKYQLNLITEKQKLFNFIRDSVAGGLLLQITGSGGSGSVKLAEEGERVLALEKNGRHREASTSFHESDSSFTHSVQVELAEAAEMPVFMAPLKPPTPSTETPVVCPASTVQNGPPVLAASPTVASISFDATPSAPSVKIEMSGDHEQILLNKNNNSVPLASPIRAQLKRQVEELRAELTTKITEKDKLEQEHRRVVNIFRDERTYPGQWCRNCFEEPQGVIMMACCDRGAYYCSQSCQHSDWARHMSNCTGVKKEPEENEF